MKIAEKLSVRGAHGTFTMFSAGEAAAQLAICGSTPAVTLGRITPEKFPGNMALPEKLRCHWKQDALSAEFDAVAVIPFGCEYHCARKVQIIDGAAVISTDIHADNGGTVLNLELEPVHFAFAPAKVEFLVFGDKSLRTAATAGELYCGPEPVIMVRVTAANGMAAEFYAGDDIWRHRCGVRLQCENISNRLMWEQNGVTLTRKVLALNADAPGEKRPWRFKSLLAWHDGTMQEKPEATAKISLPGCLAAPGNRRELRKIVRSCKESVLEISGTFPAICSDPRHLERPGSSALEHGDLAEAVNAYLWANRELKKHNGTVLFTGSSTIFGDSVTLKQLNSAPGSVEAEEEF